MTLSSTARSIVLLFLLTRPLRDVTDVCGCIELGGNISTHTPLAGRDGGYGDLYLWADRFLLTRPLRDVTIIYPVFINSPYISTHTPLAGRDHYPLLPHFP